LPADSWSKGSVEVYKFQSQVFSEVSPRGKVTQLL